MSVYDFTGENLSTLFNVDGTISSNAYDLNGANVYVKNYSINNVVSYLRQNTESVANEIKALSDDWQHFVFVTDIHGNANNQHSQAIVMYLLANTQVKYAFYGGDYCDDLWDESEYKTYFAPFATNGFTSALYLAIGNHERFGAQVSALSVVYDDFLAQKTYLNGTPSKFYYYFDNQAKKTRYMVINTSNDDTNGMSQAQLDWIELAVKLPESNWCLVVVGHIDIDATNITGTWMSTKATEITTALSSCNGEIVGYFCGHEHIDQLRLVNNKFYQLISLCDRFENNNYFNVDNYPTRTNGTATEQVVTVVSFNTSTGVVTTRRIGAGDEYSWNYKTT